MRRSALSTAPAPVDVSEWPALVVTFAEDGSALSLSADRARDIGFHRVDPTAAPAPAPVTLPAELRSALRW